MGRDYRYYDEDYYDDYDSGGRKGSKKPYKPKKKYKGHQNRFGKPSRSFWEDNEALIEIAPIPSATNNTMQTPKSVMQQNQGLSIDHQRVS